MQKSTYTKDTKILVMGKVIDNYLAVDGINRLLSLEGYTIIPIERQKCMIGVPDGWTVNNLEEGLKLGVQADRNIGLVVYVCSGIRGYLQDDYEKIKTAFPAARVYVMHTCEDEGIKKLIESNGDIQCDDNYSTGLESALKSVFG